MVQWLGLRAFTAVAWVQSLVRELRPHRLAKKKKIISFYSFTQNPIVVPHFNQSKLQSPYNDPQSLQNLASIASLDFSALIGPSVSPLSHTAATAILYTYVCPFDLAVPFCREGDIESENIIFTVAQSFPTLCNPMDGSPPGSSVHGVFHARILKWVAISSSMVSFPTQGSNSGLPHCRQILYCLNHQGSP